MYPDRFLVRRLARHRRVQRHGTVIRARVTMSLVKVWFLGTALVIAGFLVWNFAPILVPLLAVTLGLGGMVMAIVGLARHYQRKRDGVSGD